MKPDKHFFPISSHRQTYQNYQPLQIGEKVLLVSFFNVIFKLRYFLKMCPIFVSYIDNFDRSNGNLI